MPDRKRQGISARQNQDKPWEPGPLERRIYAMRETDEYSFAQIAKAVKRSVSWVHDLWVKTNQYMLAQFVENARFEKHGLTAQIQYKMRRLSKLFRETDDPAYLNAWLACTDRIAKWWGFESAQKLIIDSGSRDTGRVAGRPHAEIVIEKALSLIVNVAPVDTADEVRRLLLSQRHMDAGHDEAGAPGGEDVVGPLPGDTAGHA